MQQVENLSQRDVYLTFRAGSIATAENPRGVTAGKVLIPAARDLGGAAIPGVKPVRTLAEMASESGVDEKEVKAILGKSKTVAALVNDGVIRIS